MTNTEWWAGFVLGLVLHLAAPKRPRLVLVHPGNLTVH
jgi:hypothetical protein